MALVERVVGARSHTRGRWLACVGVLLGGCTGFPGTDEGSDSSGPASSSSGELPGSSSSDSLADTTSAPLDTTSGTDETTQGLDATEESTSSTSTTSEEGTSSTTTDGSSSTGTTGTAPEQAPVATNDEACMLRQQSSVVVADVLANDSDPQGSPLVIVGYDAVSVAGGTVLATGDDIRYIPPAGFWGEDVITYTIADPEGNEAVGEVHVMVWPGPIAASELVAGNHGLSISPDVGLGRLGWAVAGGGDLDGDGYDDVVVSAPFALGGQGRVYVVLGGPDPQPVQLTAVAAGTGGYVLYGELPNEYTGWSVAILGDLDDDGHDELAIGAGWSNANGNRAGRVTVVFSQDLGGPLALASLIGVDAFTIDGAFPEDWAGWSVSGTEDLDGDGIGEILVGAPQATDVTPGAAGSAYVVFGKADATPVLLADVLAGSGGGFAMLGQAGDHAGFSTASVPDLDGDGLPELIIGSEVAAGGAGRAYVVHGQGTSLGVSLAAVMGEVGGYGLEGAAAGAWLGRSVAGLGDLDGDGRPELMVAAPGPALAGDAAVHVIDGTNASSMVLGVPPPGQGTTIAAPVTGDDLGWSIASLPDFNGDGIPDLALGAPSAGGDFGPGAVYVVFGRPDMSGVDLLEVAQGRGGFIVTGEDWEDGTGWRVSSAGDFDGDGATDLLIGAPQAETLGNFSGRAYVVRGVAASTPELGACVPQ